MKPFNVLVALTFVIALINYKNGISATQSTYQSGKILTATGQMCTSSDN